MARSEFDQGQAPDSLPMDRMLLVLKRSAEREAALDRLLEEQQQSSSSNYHKWLTPDEFGQKFGAADADIQAITAWLQSHGFKVESPSRGRTVIEFSGNAGQVQRAFHTSIHKFVVGGKEHWANNGDPRIPVALAQAVAGVSTLHNFEAAAQLAIAETRVPINPQFNAGSGNHYLAPGDYATIYNANPLYPAINGAGTTIAVVGRSNINIQDVISFRSAFGLPANPPNIIVNGPNPGDLGAGEEYEAVLDTSWAGALATAATVDLVISKSTNTTDGVDLSEIYIINNNLANVMTESFGACETSFTSAQEASVSSLAKQAAAQGITYTVSSGDSGSAGCDLASAPSATHPVSVNGLASTPYNVAVGGTQFNENGTPSLYWNASNAGNQSSARSYIPEDVWNANCVGAVCGTGTILAAGGGASVFFAKPSWQAGVAGIPNDGVRDLPDISLTAAGHDAYLLCIAGSCSASSPSFSAVYGTSASAPAFASIVALINQKTGTRQGQLTPRLYSLMASQNLAACNGSNTAVLPAANCLINDVTVGTNAVPGEPNFNTGSQTYPATTGYDLASGLGSVNIANLVNGWSGTVTGVPSASLSPTSLTFSTQTVGVASAPQAATLSNTGTAALSIASISVGGANASDFTVSNSCGSALGAGATCAIAVTFTPGGAGSRSATLIVTSNSGNVSGSTQTTALTGTGAVATGGASAGYVGSDTATLGNWTGTYGADGQVIPNGLTNVPSYASVNVTNANAYTWTSTTTDPRALQATSGSSARIASTYYSIASVIVDLNLTDGNTHKISLYLCDWDNGARTEMISILDASSGAVLDTRPFSSFAGGVWAAWNIKGHVRISVTYTSGFNALVNGIFFDTGGSSTAGATAAYTGSDTATAGNWTGKYGADGQVIPNGLTNAPYYASVNPTGANAYTWTATTPDQRALQAASGSSARIASTYFSFSAFTIDVNLTDGNAHKVSLYLCDWDNGARAETISILDASSGAVLDTRSFASFAGGVWASWNITGHVQITVTYTGGLNALVNGIFFDTTAIAAATYTGTDTATAGNWTGKYGADGQVIPNGLTNAPSYASVNSAGAIQYTWTSTTPDQRALQAASGSSARIASTYFSFSVFTIDVNLTDGNTHKVSLYLCDWDNGARSETISILDASSGAVLDTRPFASFAGGVWASWNIKGHVQVQVAYTGGYNAILNGVFFN